MAGDLRFRIGFDLDEGIKKAIAEGPKGLKKLEDALAKHPVSVKLKLDTGRTRGTQTDLVGFRKQLAELTRQWNELTASERGGLQGAVLRERYRILQKEAQGYVSTLGAAVRQEDKLAAASNRAASATNKLTNEFKNQDGYVSRLIKRLAVYASYQRLTNFLTSVREVTAQFELQRVSLGAIIQDQTRANALFSEIKQFALKSPVSIMDLTKYTKQLAAYKFETEELFNWTKRLTDISVGLSVPMERIVLLAGQIRATGWLRGSEVRQATEAGIPLVEELASKLSMMNGELVTAKDVMDMISKRQITWEMVADVFRDMTSAGGMFYNMQEKQGNTLYGMWAKLGDAASVMYEQIGNTESVNKGMKEGIQILTDLMRNWQSVAKGIAGAGVAFIAIKMQMKLAAVSASEVGIKTAQYRIELQKLQAQYLSTSGAAKVMTLGQIGYTRIQGLATTATLAFGNALRTMKAVLVSTGWGALALAIGYVIEKMFFAKSTADKLRESLEKVYQETSVEQNKSVRNFEYLAKVATDATKSYKERKDALDELQRTYKNILPQEVLELEYLMKLKGGYDSLTNSIREYVAEQQRRKTIDTISEEYGATKLKYERKLTDFLRGENWSEQEIARFWEQFYKGASDKSKALEQVVADAAEKGGHDGFDTVMKLLKNQGGLTKDLDKKSYNLFGLSVFGNVDYIDLLRDAILEENKALEQNEERQKAAATATSKFAEAQAKLAEKIASTKYVGTSGKDVDRNSYLGQQMLKNENIKGIGEYLKEEFEKAGLEWQSGFDNLVQQINVSKPELISSLDFTAITGTIKEKLKDPDLEDAQRELLTDLLTTAQQAQQAYWEIVPKDPVVRTWRQRFRTIANSVGEFQTRHNQYLMQAGEDLQTYNKRLQTELEGLKNNVMGLLSTQAKVLKAGIFAKALYGVSADELKKLIDQANEDIEMVEKTLAEQPSFDKSKGRGRQSDPRLQNLKEEISLVQKLYNEYKQLEKQKGATAAAADMRKLAGTTIDMFKEKYGFDLPTDAKDLTSALEILYKKMAALPKKVFPSLDKDLKELRWTIEKVNIDESQKQIEAELKSLAERISRTKTAKEFYEKILGQTGDVELAADMTVSVYGQTGQGLQKEIATQLGNALRGVTAEGETIGVNVYEEGVIDPATFYVNYKKLREIVEKQGGKLSDAQKKILDDMLKNGEAYNKAQVEQWAKDLAKVKDYTDQYIDLYRMTEKRKAEIRQKMASGELSGDAGKQEIAGYDARLTKEQSKIQYEMFKNSPMYTSLFENMENATVQSLQNMRKQIEKMMAVTKEPTQLKELQNRLNEIDDTLAEKSPFEVIAKGWQTMGEMAKKYGSRSNLDNLIKKKQAELDALQAELDAALEKETQTKQFAEMMGVDVQNPSTAITPIQKAALAAYQQASADVMKYGDAVKKADNEQQQLTSDASKWAAAMGNVKKGLKTIVQIGQKLLQASEAAADFAEALGMSEDGLELFRDINNVISQTLNFADALIGCVDLMAKTTAQSISTVEKASVILTVISTALQVATAIFNMFSGSKVRRANKEIKRQQELLDQLERAYRRLEAAENDLFGHRYIENFNNRRTVLEAEAEAYQKQLEAEKSKGKKADEERMKQFEDAYRDTMERIKEMDGELQSHFLGTDRAAAAREWAQSWLEAKVAFGNTADAIKSKYKDMIKSMIVEGAAARIIDRVLEPMWKAVGEMLGKNDLEGAIDYVIRNMDVLVNNADEGLNTLWKALEAKGYDLRRILGDSADGPKGIAREFSTASEESINGLASMYAVETYYTSHLPTISENVAAMRALMEGGGVSAGGSAIAAVDYTSMIQRSLENQNMMIRYQDETLKEMKAQTELFKKVITPKGVSGGTHQINVRM